MLAIRVAALVGLLLLAGGAGAAAADETAVYLGRPLIQVLRELRSAGLELIYSSALVGDDLVVTVEPTATDSRKLLQQILEPLGLRAEEGPGGSILIVPGPSAEAPGTVEPIRDPGFSTTVVVTPGRHSLLDEEQVASREIDPAETLRVPNIGNDISRMVERLPGIAAGDNTAAYHARGSLALDSSLVLDGLELYEPYHLLSFQAPFSLVDSRVTERVELKNGGFTADRGDRHGAFLDVATITPSDAPHGEAELGTLSSRIAYGAPVSGGKGAWLVSARAWYPEALLDTIELGAGERLQPRFGDVFAKFLRSVSPKMVLSAHGLFSYDKLNWQEQGEPDNEDVDSTTESAYLWLKLAGIWPADVESTTVLSGGRIDRERSGVGSPDNGIVTLSDDREVSFLGLTHDMGWQAAASHRIKAGVYLRRLEARYRYSNVFLEDPGASEIVALDPTGTSLGLYAAYRARISRSVVSELGLRWDRQHYTEDNQLGPRFNLLWRVGERSDLRFAIGQFSQSQRIHELHVEDGQTEYLPAETARQIELTYHHEFSDTLRLRVDAYDRRLSDLRPRFENLYQPLDLFPETSEDRVTFAPDEARLRGIEILLRGNSERRWSWSTSYTWSSAEDQIDGQDVPRSWDQPHAAQFLVGRAWGDRWFVSLAGTAHTGWPTTPALGVLQPDGSVEIEPVPGQRNASRLPTYVRFDLKARRSFTLSRGRLSLTFDVINVTDRENACCVDDFDTGLSPDGSVTVESVYSYWLGFTPSFQVRWEF